MNRLFSLVYGEKPDIKDYERYHPFDQSAGFCYSDEEKMAEIMSLNEAIKMFGVIDQKIVKGLIEPTYLTIDNPKNYLFGQLLLENSRLLKRKIEII